MPFALWVRCGGQINGNQCYHDKRLDTLSVMEARELLIAEGWKRVRKRGHSDYMLCPLVHDEEQPRS